MLFLDVRSLARQAATVSGELPPSDPVWQGADLLPSTPVVATGRVSSAGGGRYYWSGHIQGVVSQACTRCLDPVESRVEEDVRALFAEPGAEGGDDPDVYELDPNSAVLDLRPAIREHWLLAAPRYALCREDCKGFCPTCGENLNSSSCSCAPAADSRWDALRKAQRP